MNGMNGMDGTDGTGGTDEADGRDGRDWRNGTDGTDGTDGTAGMDFPSYNSSTSYCIGSVLVQVVKKQENIILPETNKEKVDPRIRIEL